MIRQQEESSEVASAIPDVPRSSVRWWQVITLLVTTGACAPLAWPLMFNKYAFYEDEGYLLVTLREWVQRGGLYSRVFSRYGPAYMFVFGLPMRLLRIDVNFFSGRIITMTVWLLTSLFFGLTVLVITHRVLPAVLTQVVSFFLLQTLTDEPMHPGGLIALALALIVFVMAAVRPARPRLGDALLGILAGVVVMTEVNIGIFSVVALAYLYVVLAKSRTWESVRPYAEAVLVVMGPLLILVDQRSGPQWAINYATMYFSAALITVALVRISVPPDGDPSFEKNAPTRFAVWLVVSVVFFLAFTVATGTGPIDAVQAIFFAPLGQSASLIIAAPISNADVWWLIVPAFLFLAFPWLKRMVDHDVSAPRAPVWLVIAIIRIVAGTIGIVVIAQDSFGASVRPFSLVPLACACIFPRPPSAERGLSPSRLLLVMLAVTNSLHAFPVAGSQISWSVMLVVPALAVAFYDGCVDLTAWWDREPVRKRAPLRPLALVLALLLLLFIIFIPWPSPDLLDLSRASFSSYDAATPLDLPGTFGIRLPSAQVTALRTITAALRKDCAAFVSVPGYDSLYLLTGIEPPNGMNATVWMYLFDNNEQQSVVRALTRTRGNVCLVERSGLALDVHPAIPPLVGVNQSWAAWSWVMPIPFGPLVAYLDKGFVPLASLPPYLILVKTHAAPADNP